MAAGMIAIMPAFYNYKEKEGAYTSLFRRLYMKKSHRILLVRFHWPELGEAGRFRIVALQLGSWSSQYIKVLFLRQRGKQVLGSN